MARIEKVPSRVARALPARLMQDRKILPFRIAPEGMEICSPEVPDAETVKVIAGFTRLEVRFFLVPPTRFRALQESALGSPDRKALNNEETAEAP